MALGTQETEKGPQEVRLCVVRQRDLDAATTTTPSIMRRQGYPRQSWSAAQSVESSLRGLDRHRGN